MRSPESTEWKSRILETELKLCDKMLGMDERNFHCWNYRLLTSLLYLKEIGLRLGEGKEAAMIEFLNKECEMAEKLIRKNFSNYSAWHYRGKLLPELHKLLPYEGARIYPIPFEKIQEDLALLKHAFFTDPKDQSPWNYHEWLISLLSPVQVVSLTFDSTPDGRNLLVIGLSKKVRDFPTAVKIRLHNDLGQDAC